MSERPSGDGCAGLHEAALEALGFPVLLHDRSLVLYANALAREILGAANRDEIEGLPLDTFLDPDLTPVAHERREYLISNKASFSEVPIKMYTLDGRTIRLTVDARPIEFEGRTVGMVTVTR